VADRYCDLCRKAREDEEERACPSTLPALVLRTLGDRPGNEDQLRGISSDPMGAMADALRDQAEARAEDDEGPHDLPMVRMAKEIGARDDYRRHD
jgi:hypothetical protein